MTFPANKKIYFLSDFHLGAPDAASSLQREKQVVKFLDEIKHDAHEIFLVGDMFDFWYEYRRVIPKGYTRLLGKLAELSDLGIQMHFPRVASYGSFRWCKMNRINSFFQRKSKLRVIIA